MKAITLALLGLVALAGVVSYSYLKPPPESSTPIQAVALESTPTVLPESLSPSVRVEGPRNGAVSPGALPAGGFDLEEHVKEIERGYIAQALERAGGVQVKAAELLGMSFRSFRYYVKKYNLR